MFRTGDSKRAKQVTIGLTLVTLTALALWRDDNTNAPFNGYGPRRRALAVGLFAALAFGLGWMAASKLQVQAPIAAVYPERRGKGCHFKIELRGGSLPGAVRPCASQELWVRAQPGATATLVLASSEFGTQVLDVRLAE